MFGFLKNLLRKPAAAPVQNAEPEHYAEEPAPEAAYEYEQAPPAPQYAQHAYAPPPPPPAPRQAAPIRFPGQQQFRSAPAPAPARHPQNGGGVQNGRGVEVPLQPILEMLPLELQPRILQPDVGNAVIYVPLDKVLSQLSRGAVKISFGELRQLAPGYFTPEPDRDRVPVSLPLAEILSRLNPALITRRRVQKQIEVPADITSPFDPTSQALAFSPNQEPAPATAPMARQVTPGFPGPAVRHPAITSTPTPPPPAAQPFPIQPTIAGSRPSHDFGNGGRPTPPPAAPRPKPAAPVAPPPPPEQEVLLVGLTSLAEAWPEAVRKEIVQFNLVDARLGLPAEAIEQALKQGRIAFSWKAVRSWLKPAPPMVTSPNDGTLLELPLKVVAPLFLARQKEAGKGQQKVSIDAEIPNLFFGFPQPDTSGTAVSKPVDTNYYIWDDNSDTARVASDEVKRPTPGTKFVARYATPNEVVSRAGVLEGVSGALIALPDGLMVASHLSPDLNGDTLAAFLPQIFGKVTQCTKELRMGELNNLSFTVGNVPWKIFRVNAIFFAVFGKAGQPLPTAQLAALAAELDHKAK